MQLLFYFASISLDGYFIQINFSFTTFKYTDFKGFLYASHTRTISKLLQLNSHHLSYMWIFLNKTDNASTVNVVWYNCYLKSGINK